MLSIKNTREEFWAEGFYMLEPEIKDNLSIILLDTMGVYWPSKYPNHHEEELLKEFLSTIHIKISEVDKPGSGMNNKSTQRLNKKEVTKQLEKDPVINKLIDEFGLELT